jgi:prevent-host-death family protein
MDEFWWYLATQPAICDYLDSQERIMSDVSLADAKAQLSDLIERAMRGEDVRITRRGKPVARLVAIDRERKPIDLAELRALTDAMTPQTESAGSWLRAVRDESRY